MEDLHFRLERLGRLSFDNRDKQRLICNQLVKVDDSIFELEERVTSLNHLITQQQADEEVNSLIASMEN